MGCKQEDPPAALLERTSDSSNKKNDLCIRVAGFIYLFRSRKRSFCSSDKTRGSTDCVVYKHWPDVHVTTMKSFFQPSVCGNFLNLLRLDEPEQPL